MADIITMDPGFHNAKMVDTIHRLTDTGNWKKQRIVYLIPGGASIPSRVYLSHRSLMFPPNQGMVPLYVEGAEVGAAFQAGIDMILENEELKNWEYLLTIEHDNIPQPNGVIRLLEAFEKHPEFDAISGLYFTKGEGGCAQIWGDIRDPIENYRPQIPRPNEVVECYGIGMGFVLYKMAMFRKLAEKKVEKPWFKTVGSKSEDMGSGTQDLYFWGRVARPNGFRCAVDCSVLVGHYDPNTKINW